MASSKPIVLGFVCKIPRLENGMASHVSAMEVRSEATHTDEGRIGSSGDDGGAVSGDVGRDLVCSIVLGSGCLVGERQHR